MVPFALADVAALVAFVVMFGIVFTYRYTLGALLLALANLLGRIPLGIGGALAAPVHDIDNYIRHVLGEGLNGTEWAWKKTLHWTAYAIEHPGRVLGDLAEATEQALQTLRSYTLPKVVGVPLRPLAAAVALLRRQVAHLASQVAHVIEVPPKVIWHKVTQLERKVLPVQRVIIHTVTAAAATAIALPRVGIGRLEREVAAEKARLGKLEKTAGIAAVGIVAGALLSRLGLGWTRCSKVGRLGRAACGMNESLIEDLLAGALVVAGSISIVELARECQAFTGEVDAGVRFFVRELR